MTIQQAIKQDVMYPFRRLYLKTRESGGDYASDWEQVPPELIKKWGTITFGIDDIKVNFFKYSGANLTVDNSTGYFSDTSDSQSIFYQKISRVRTFLKIEAGYIDVAGNEWPTNPTIFIGLVAEDMPYQQDNLVKFQTKHISSIFEEFPVADISGRGVTQTASELIGNIRDHTDSNGSALFQKYLSLGAWNIQTTTNTYNMATTTTLEGLSCWDMMKKLAEAENKLIYISREGDFFFHDKDVAQSISVWHFSGLGDEDRSYGKNVMKRIKIEYNAKKVYNRIRIKHAKDDTDTSYYIRNETWNWGDSSSSFLYGVRTYEYNNEWMDTATAEIVGDTLYEEYKFPKQEVKLDTKFVPQLDINDRTSLTYQTTESESSTGALWGNFNWGGAKWGDVSGGFNINIIDSDFMIINMKHNIDVFKTMVTLREVE